jgi:homoserine O-acetyltransferase
MADHDIFDAGSTLLQSGITLRGARLAYKTHGKLNADKSNAIIYPTRFYGTHDDNAFLIGSGKALDPDKYFIVVPDLTGNGLSSSPSNTPEPFDRARFPGITILDNVMLQRRLLREVFGIERLALAVGWSMGAQQAYHWAALCPDEVERIAPIAGSARTSPHNHVFLEGVKAALTADAAWQHGWYDTQPKTGLRAMGRCWAGWALSQTFYREHVYRQLGYSSVEDFLVGFWEGLFLLRDANNMLAQIWTWQHSDISDNETYAGDFEKALASITARAIVMPGETDLYFPPADSAYEVEHMPNGELRVIPSVWGHYAGGAANADDVAFVDKALKELLSD